MNKSRLGHLTVARGAVALRKDKTVRRGGEMIGSSNQLPISLVQAKLSRSLK